MTKKILANGFAILGLGSTLLFLGFIFSALLKLGNQSDQITKMWLDFIASITSSLAWPISLAAAIFFLRKSITPILGRIRKISAGGVEVDVEAALNIAESEKENIPPIARDERIDHVVIATDTTPKPSGEPSDIPTRPSEAIAPTEPPPSTENNPGVKNDELVETSEPNLNIYLEQIRKSNSEIKSLVQTIHNTALATNNPNAATLLKWKELEKVGLQLLQSGLKPEKEGLYTTAQKKPGLIFFLLEVHEVVKQLRTIRNSVVHTIEYEMTLEETLRFIALADDLIERWKTAIALNESNL